MANWNTLKKTIADAIKTNGNQEITGALLQSVLNSMVNSMGKNATFVDIATPDTDPGVPEGPVFYLATEIGTYYKFNDIKVAEGEVVILQHNGGSWTKKVTGLVTQQVLDKAIITTLNTEI